VLFSNGQHWTEQRRFALRTLRDLGFGKTGMEQLVAEEAQAMVDKLDDLSGSFVQSRQLFHPHALRALWTVMTNESSASSAKLQNSRLAGVWRKMERLFEQGNHPLFGLLLNHPKLAKVSVWGALLTLQINICIIVTNAL
jgi:hypothetical protein